MATTPMPAGPSGGIMGVDFRTNKLGLAVGGDFSLARLRWRAPRTVA